MVALVIASTATLPGALVEALPVVPDLVDVEVDVDVDVLDELDVDVLVEVDVDVDVLVEVDVDDDVLVEVDVEVLVEVAVLVVVVVVAMVIALAMVVVTVLVVLAAVAAVAVAAVTVAVLLVVSVVVLTKFCAVANPSDSNCTVLTVPAAVVGVVITRWLLVVVVVGVVVIIVVVWTSNNDAHTLKPSPNTLSSLDHISSAPLSTFAPCGPESPLNSVPPTVIKSNPASTSYCAVLTTRGRNATTLQLSSAPYSPSPSDTHRPSSTILQKLAPDTTPTGTNFSRAFASSLSDTSNTATDIPF